MRDLDRRDVAALEALALHEGWHLVVEFARDRLAQAHAVALESRRVPVEEREEAATTWRAITEIIEWPARALAEYERNDQEVDDGG